ncbi:hypothetical protein ACQKWADRAFT_226245 [Trichoderma austrokoningii]
MAASPDSGSSQTPKSLASDMVSVTRPMHTKINKLVTSRLPLAVPPKAPDSGPYACGLLHILPIYMTFEQLWLDILDAPPGDDDAPDQVPERVRTILKEIYLPQLFRSDCLRADIRSMTGWSDDVLDLQINGVRATGELSVFISHIKQIVRAKPHVLIAYSYNLSMALFAGGRFIRAMLEKVGEEFWQIVPKRIIPTMQPSTASDVPLEHNEGLMPLRFWTFDSENEGEDLKQEYKGKLLQWESELTTEERQDVLQESIFILESIGLLVGQLDAVCSELQDETPDIQMSMRSSFADLLGSTQFGARLRDSLLIARERGIGNAFRRKSADAVEDEKGVIDDTTSGVSKSMRFAQSLPIPPRVAKSDASGTMMGPALVGVFGLFFLYVLYNRVGGIIG